MEFWPGREAEMEGKWRCDMFLANWGHHTQFQCAWSATGKSDQDRPQMALSAAAVPRCCLLGTRLRKTTEMVTQSDLVHSKHLAALVEKILPSSQELVH